MTLNFGEVVSKEMSGPKVEAFLREFSLQFLKVCPATTNRSIAGGTSVDLMLEVGSLSSQDLANHWAKTAPNGKCEMMSFN